MISRIKSGRLHVEQGQVVLRSADYQHFLQAREITRSAQNHAREMRDQAARAYEEARRKGHQEGLAEGERQLIARHIDFVRNAIEFTARLETNICSLAKEAITKIVGEMDIDELTRKIVVRALAHYGSLPEVKLRVATRQEKQVRAQLEKMTEESKQRGIKFIRVVGDRQLRSGDCILDSPIGSVDASLDTQLAAIIKTLDDPIGRKLHFQQDQEDDES